MQKVLIVYHSETGNTEMMARAIAEGSGGELKSVEETTNEDLIKADAIVLGSPTYFRQMSWKMKKFIDESIDVWKKLEGKIGGVFTSAGYLKDGKKCLNSLKDAMECHGIKVVGSVISERKPNKNKLRECKMLGEKIASMVKKCRKKSK